MVSPIALLRLLSMAVCAAALAGCSMGQMVARSSSYLLDSGVASMNRETDLDLAKAAIPANLKLCQKGTWNERMRVETALSMVTVVCDRQQHPSSSGSLHCSSSGRGCGDVQCVAHTLSSASS